MFHKIIKLETHHVWMTLCLLSFLYPASAQSGSPKESIASIQAALQAKKFDQAMHLASRLSSILRPKISEADEKEMRDAANLRTRAPGASVNAMEIAKACETELNAGNSKLAYQYSMMLINASLTSMLAQDPTPRYLAAMEKFKNDRTFSTAYELALASHFSKHYSDTLDAAESAWLMRSNQRSEQTVADPVHNVLQLGALSAIALNQLGAAGSLMMRSVDLPGRMWARARPEFKAAKLLLDAQQRDIVNAYLVACSKIPWKEGAADLNRWIEELNQGKTPALPNY